MRRSHSLVALFSPFLVLLACPTLARGQPSTAPLPEPPPPPPLPPASATATAATPATPRVDDVVILTNDSRFRGTITELVPDDHVVLLLPSGESRRFEWTIVDYAGPAAKAPDQEAPSPPPPPPRPRPVEEPVIAVSSTRVDVKVVSDQPDVQLLVRAGQSEVVGVGYSSGGHSFVTVGRSQDYAAVCTAPCELRMAKGSHRLALALGKGGAVEPWDPVRLEGPSTLRLHYASRAMYRGVGWAIAIASLSTGGILAATATTTDVSSHTTTLSTSQVGLGLGIGVVGTIVGLIFIAQRDEASIQVVPRSMTSLLRVGGAEGAWVTPEAPGLALRGRF